MTERDLFIAALQKEGPDQRRAYLDEVCAGQPELRRQVEELLRLHQGAGDFLNRPAAEVAATGPSPGTAVSSDASLGPYKLIEPIGEGGMGTVWMAQQQEPVKRLVAIKLIKAGMGSKQVLARFEAERQALALMDHANIARVLDAGTTAAGRPYFVMELVKGVPLTRYCDEHHLTPRQRLELFIPVCQAVQHAHQKGIIHRDLKPSNVLVALYDGKPVPKVIDFGVAKAIGPALTEQTLVTGFGAIVGTLEYMSPEQAEVNQLDVDTRSDVYSLGVLLYELLTGSPPFTRRELEEAGVLELLRVIREQEPSKPSTRLSTAEGLPTLAANRGTEPAQLTNQVRGELDWIVMKALEKDRNRRYATANALALDLQRYLADEPVLAGPPSARYRLRKFVQRHQGAVVAVGLLLLALASGIVGTSWQAVRAEQRAEGERQAKVTAERRLAQLEKGNEVLSSIFTNLNPDAEEKEGKPLRAILGERLIQVADQLEEDAVGDPLVVARLQVNLGQSMLGLGMTEQAIVLLTRAQTTHATQLGPDHPVTLDTMRRLGWAYRRAGKHERAVALLEETLTLTKARLGPDNAQTLNCMNALSSAYGSAGRLERALDLYEETLRLQKAGIGPGHRDTLATMVNLASGYRSAGKHDQAVSLLRESLKLAKANLSPAHPTTLIAMGNLAMTYRDIGKFDLALEQYEEALRLAEAHFGPNHEYALTSVSGVADCLARLNRDAEAIAILDDALRRPGCKTGATRLVRGLIYLRLRHFEKARDASGCRTTAEKWERLNRTDVNSLYQAACNRAVTAAIVTIDPKVLPADAMRLAREEGDRAMTWLHQSVAAGFTDVTHLKKDRDLDALREREDFKKLLAELETKQKLSREPNSRPDEK